MKVAILSESPEVVRRLRECLARSAGRHRESWIAYDCGVALERCQADPPDLVLLDLALTNPDAVAATRRLTGERSCPVLIVAQSVSASVSRVFDALGAGALGAVDLPRASEAAAELLAKIDAMERVAVKAAPARAPEPPRRRDHDALPRLVVIGASTGGPQALALILGGLPADFPAAIVIIQHVDARLADGLAEWLAAQAHIRVSLAREGATIHEGEILVAGTDDHLVLTPERRLHYTPDPLDCPYRPSVDAFFKSAAAHWPAPATAVLLTGMGRDGADGLLALRQAGWHTIAQDQATSVVYGMPRVAAERQAAVAVLPVEKIALALLARHRAGGDA